MKKMLLIIDVQKGFINEKTKHIPSLVEQLQYEYEYVYVTKFLNSEHSLYRELIHWNRFSPESEETQLAFSVKNNAIIKDKYIYTCVDDDFLEFIKNNGIDQVDICGIDTDICVTKCAVDLFEKGIKPCVLSSYCATHAAADVQEASLIILKRFIGRDQVI